MERFQSLKKRVINVQKSTVDGWVILMDNINCMTLNCSNDVVLDSSTHTTRFLRFCSCLN